jgi:hypothetical protein
VAASLEGQGKAAEAIKRYEEMGRRPPDSTVIQVRTALAHLYATQGQPAQAMRLYDQILRDAGGRPDSWALESRLEGEKLVASQPALLNEPLTAPAQAVPTVDLPTNSPPTFNIPVTNSPIK